MIVKSFGVVVMGWALAGCAAYQDPEASREDVVWCRAVAHKDAHDNTPWVDVLAMGAPIAHRLRQRDSFEACMAQRGYRVAAEK